MTLWLTIACFLFAESAAAPHDPHALARQIDRRLADGMQAAAVAPVPLADDAEFLRRLSLDLIGRIPMPDEVIAFLDDPASDKRSRMVDRLLNCDQHAQHFARVWRSLLLPEIDTEPQVRYFVPGLEAWLVERRRENAGFDAIVRELLTVPIAGPDEPPQFVLRDLRRPNPLAYIAAHSAEPAKIASSSVRLFLGLRLECAQCHDHPFDDWTREQFWNQAAFFAGIKKRGGGTFAPLVEDSGLTTVSIMDSADRAPALFLDRTEPQFADGQPPRVRFAEWMTSPANPFFARAVVNRIWSQLMGRGLVEPVDDFRETNEASHPELLRDLADAFVATGFDLDFLLREICLSEAYQRTSRHTGEAPAELFAHMTLKPMSGEQFFDSLAQAIGYEAPEGRGGDRDDPLRRRVLGLFADPGQTGAPETSVAQALALMNGSVVAQAVSPATGKHLAAILAEFPNSPERQIEALYLAALSRRPSVEEKQTLREFCGQGGEAENSRRLGDVFWTLLNSPEFRWNH